MMRCFSGVKVFSATWNEHRNFLGEQVTMWLHRNPAVEVLEYSVAQSSDDGHHCLSITLFYATRASERAGHESVPARAGSVGAS